MGRWLVVADSAGYPYDTKVTAAVREAISGTGNSFFLCLVSGPHWSPRV